MEEASKDKQQLWTTNTIHIFHATSKAMTL